MIDLISGCLLIDLFNGCFNSWFVQWLYIWLILA